MAYFNQKERILLTSNEKKLRTIKKTERQRSDEMIGIQNFCDGKRQTRLTTEEWPKNGRVETNRARNDTTNAFGHRNIIAVITVLRLRLV